MTNVFAFSPGPSPLLLSIPHDGRDIPATIRARMTATGLAIPDTDWHVGVLYDFAGEFGANVLAANYSRYVIDLNRSADDGVLYPGQTVTGMCPEKTFAGEAIYTSGHVSAAEKADRVRSYWRPYHDQLAATLRAIRDEFGYALLWDAHSIASFVPLLFEGELPVLNLGSNSGESCGTGIESSVTSAARSSSFSTVSNARFKGGYITRNYGAPESGVHALQLEIAQRAYMNEQSGELDDSRAENLRVTLRSMLQAFLDTAKQ